MGPDTNSGKEMALRVVFEVIWFYILYRSLVNVTRRDMPSFD